MGGGCFLEQKFSHFLLSSSCIAASSYICKISSALKQLQQLKFSSSNYSAVSAESALAAVQF